MAMKRYATISDCGKYRYDLHRCWNPDGPNVVFVMLNPSTADASLDDPTVRRVMSFAMGLDYGSVTIVNLFAMRATYPRELKFSDDPVGPLNDSYVSRACTGTDKVVCAWGTNGSLFERHNEVMEWLPLLAPTFALHINMDGSPKHPLYIGANANLIDFKR